MRVAVITPYFKEPIEALQRCHQSVLFQSHQDVTHFFVADGHANPALDEWDIKHLKLPDAHSDYGDTPRVIGALSAASSGFDAVCLLDADNWYEPDHIEQLVAKQKETDAQVVTATRILRRADGSKLAVCLESDGNHFNDTNCYLVTRPAFGAFGPWGFKDKRASIVGDRVFWNTIKSNFTRAHCMMPTVNYTTMFACHYLANKEAPPEGAKVIATVQGDQYPRMFDYPEFVRLTTPPA